MTKSSLARGDMLVLLGDFPALIRKVPRVTVRGEWKVISDGDIGTLSPH